MTPEIEKRYTVDKRIYHIIERDSQGQQTFEGFFPSVTTILDKTEPKNYLLNQFQLEEVEKKGIEGARFALFMAAERGTKIHKAIENFNMGKPVRWHEEKEIDGEKVYVNNYDDFEWKAIAKYMGWRAKYKPNFLELEKEVYSKKWGYAGTTDAIAMIGSSLMVCDWKSSKDTFDKYKMQIAAYCVAYEEMTGKKPDGGLVLALRYERSKEGFKCDMMDDSDVQHWFRRFQTRLTLFKEMEPDFEPKRDLLPVAFFPEGYEAPVS